jgi:ABC-2 type transport system permease protein
LLLAFECLWAKVTYHITQEVLRPFIELIRQRRAQGTLGLPAQMFTDQQALREILDIAFRGPGQIIQVLIGGDSINLMNTRDMLSIGYVHSLVQTILCVWAIGRAAGAVAGELDRGTLELLLAQPLPRWKLILAHFYVDMLTIPILCLSMWAGTALGAWLMGMTAAEAASQRVNPWLFGPALLNTAALVFAVSGYTMLLSAVGRFRNRVLGVAVLLTLLQFLINVLGQLWEPIRLLRPFTVFYYYQPQPMILDSEWFYSWAVWYNLLILLLVGSVGYLLALEMFRRRDLPAPL